MSDPGSHDESVGAVGEEAAQLLAALADWARDHGSELGTGVAGLAGQAAESARQVSDHLATGDAECQFCPVCRAVHLVRQASPEVRSHLTSATSSLLQAAAGLVAAAAAAGGSPGAGPGRRSGVQRIDLDGEDPS